MRRCSRPIRLPRISHAHPCVSLRGQFADVMSVMIERARGVNAPAYRLLASLQSASQEGGHLGAGDLLGGTVVEQCPGGAR